MTTSQQTAKNRQTLHVDKHDDLTDDVTDDVTESSDMIPGYHAQTYASYAKLRSTTNPRRDQNGGVEADARQKAARPEKLRNSPHTNHATRSSNAARNGAQEGKGQSASNTQPPRNSRPGYHKNQNQTARDKETKKSQKPSSKDRDVSTNTSTHSRDRDSSSRPTKTSTAQKPTIRPVSLHHFRTSVLRSIGYPAMCSARYCWGTWH